MMTDKDNARVERLADSFAEATRNARYADTANSMDHALTKRPLQNFTADLILNVAENLGEEGHTFVDRYADACEHKGLEPVIRAKVIYERCD